MQTLQYGLIQISSVIQGVEWGEWGRSITSDTIGSAPRRRRPWRGGEAASEAARMRGIGAAMFATSRSSQQPGWPDHTTTDKKVKERNLHAASVARSSHNFFT